jgi:hypothetical protein
MPSHELKLIVNLGLHNSPTCSVDTSALAMDHTFIIDLPLSSMSHVETMVVDIPQDNIVKIHEDLANQKNQLSDEDMSKPDIPIIENLHHMIQDMDGMEVTHNIAQIFEFFFPTTSTTFSLNISLGGISIPPPITMASIPTYKNPNKTTFQPTNNIIPSLGVFTRIFNPCNEITCTKRI